MRYKWSYLWGGAYIQMGTELHNPWDLQLLGPSALDYLTTSAVTHLKRSERFSLCIDRGISLPLGHPPVALERLARDVAKTMTSTIRHKDPGIDFTTCNRTYGRHSVYVQFIPADEWHPEPTARTKPALIECDASWRSPQQARAGIARAGNRVVTVDLALLEARSSIHAEYFGLCLAMLTGISERLPLLISCDSEAVVDFSQLITEGLVPPWIHSGANDLAQRLAIAAMTCAHLRPVTVQWVPRRKVTKADSAARYDDPSRQALNPKTWANYQGMPLSWLDKDRGVVRSEQPPLRP